MTLQRNISEVIKLNKERNAILDSYYDPLTGEGSFLKRTELRYTDEDKNASFFAPDHMFNISIIQKLQEVGSVEKLVESQFGVYSKPLHQRLRNELLNLRLDEDFEFYAYTCVKIPDKDKEDLVSFKLNRPQRKLLTSFESRRIANKPIRTIIDKARQWGGSTLTQIYMNWIQLRHRKRWNAAICAFVEAQAVHVRQMLNTTIENFPESIAKYTLSNYSGFNSKNKVINERDCVIGVGSTERPENLRTYNYRMLHATELGSWKNTPEKSGSAMLQSLRGSIRNLPYTMVVLESTAKGVGNLFHNEWTYAIEGKSGYDPVFIGWFEIEMYREEISDFESFISNMDEYAWSLWDLGATLEGINWYYNHKQQENMSDLAMHQEFPSTWQESFESTGRPAFDKIHIQRMYSHCKDPVFIGDIHGKSVKGKDAFKDIRFVEQKNGDIWIWEFPDQEKVSNRYCGFLDIGGRTAKADYTTLKVFDGYWMIEGGKPEVVAVYHTHLDQDLSAWKAAQLLHAYGIGLFAVEIQSLKSKGEAPEGDHSLTVLDEISPYYPNLYTRTNPEDIRQGIPAKYGFSTNRLTKPMLVDTLNECLRDELYVERDKRSLDEMYYYELKEDGSYGATDGKKDDLVMTSAGGLWLRFKYMSKPVRIIEQPRTTRKVVNESTI